MIPSNKNIHIVAFDVPYPADYGGVIDIFYKIEALNKLGVEVTLHCFQYGRSKSRKLNSICKKVYYYKRNSWKNPFLNSLPYIVCTRNSSELLDNLLKDEAPILFEGLHTTFFLRNPELKNRMKVVRMHNIEHDYYRNLEKVETNFFKKYFYKIESDKLKKYQKHLKHADVIAAISKQDTEYLKKHFSNVVQVSAFHPNESVIEAKPKDKFAFYHGNLSVGENNHAAIYLVEQVFNDLEIPLVIAGKHPSSELLKAAEKHPHIKIEKGLSSEKIMKMISDAHINVLPTFQKTGIKLKLLNALYLGKHCLVTPDMVENTGLEKLCAIGKTDQELKDLVTELMSKEFNCDELLKREELLEPFSNSYNAEKLYDIMIQHKIHA